MSNHSAIVFARASIANPLHSRPLTIKKAGLDQYQAERAGELHVEAGFRVHALLDGADEPLPPEAVSAAFAKRNTAKRKARVEEVLTIMADLGLVRAGERDGATLYFTRR